MYIEAGADAVFPEGLRSAEEFEQVGKEVNTYLLANMTEFGTTPYLTVDEFGALGYNMVIFPVTLQRIAIESDGRCAKNDQGFRLERESSRPDAIPSGIV